MLAEGLGSPSPGDFFRCHDQPGLLADAVFDTSPTKNAPVEVAVAQYFSQREYSYLVPTYPGR